ncbi:MAG: hypothetical protein WCY05_03755 [Candidatus Omnitrophota bacterium]
MVNNSNEKLLILYDLFKSIKKSMKIYDIDMNITEIGAIHYVQKCKQVSMTDLSIFLEIAPPSATFLVNKLIERKIFKRTEKDGDRRGVIISLSSSGVKIFKKAYEEKRKIEKKLISSLSKEELNCLKTILNKIFENKQDNKK